MKFFKKSNKFSLLILAVLFVLPVAFFTGGCGSSSDPEPAYKTMKVAPGGEFKVLQLTDIHLTGAPANIHEILEPGKTDRECGVSAYDKDCFALQAMDDLVAQTKPDFIAVTGDLAYVNEEIQKDDIFAPGTGHTISIGHNDNLEPIKRFVERIESYNIPWAFVFGNHDAEGIHKRKDLGGYFEDRSNLKNCVFKSGPEDVDGVGNYVVNVENSDGTINKALVFIDSHSYLSPEAQGDSWFSKHFPDKYDYIHTNQLEWYETALKDVAKEYRLPEGDLPKSFCFFHIPLVEYKTAWDTRDTSPDSQYIHGVNGEVKMDWSDPSNPRVIATDCVCHPFVGTAADGIDYDGGKMFDKILALGSTEAVFCGHDHLNNYNVKYKGVNLVFGKAIDYAAYAPVDKDDQRGATLITIKDGGSFDIQNIDYHGDLYNKFIAEHGRRY